METIFITRALLALLAIALIYACIDDWRRRIIENWLTAGIALAAPILWWANGFTLGGIGIQIAMAIILFLVFLIFFMLGMMGGGDVKLIAALALWFPLVPMMNMLVVMAILGGVLTLGMMIRHKLRKDETPLEVPYGIAIALAGLWTIADIANVGADLGANLRTIF
jgi:prepilin peptidase CpaA